MDDLRIGKKEIAIIIEQVKPKSGTYRAIKAVVGKIIRVPYAKDFSYIFIDDDGNQYYHFIDYEPEEKNKQYFIGRYPLINESEEDIYNIETKKIFDPKPLTNEQKQHIAELLVTHQKYNYRQINNRIIAIDLKTNKRTRYIDDIVLLIKEIDDSIYETEKYYGSTFLEQENDDKNEEIKKENSLAHRIIESDNLKNNILDKRPCEIVSEVEKYVKGQSEAIKKIVTSMYTYLKYPNTPKENMLVVGPTGVGKSYIFKTLAKLFDMPFIKYDVPGITQSGYVGRSVDDIIMQLISACNGDEKKAEHGIIFLDELDKIAYSQRSDGSVATEGVQNELLSLIEEDDSKQKRKISVTYNHKSIDFDPAKVLFIGAGAFQNIFDDDKKVVKTLGFGNDKTTEKEKKIKKELTQDDIKKFGLKAELVGRLPNIICLNNLTEDDFADIILNSENGIMKQHEKLFKELGITITNIPEIVHIIAADAIDKQIGARGINSTLTKIFNNVRYEALNSIGEYDTLTFGKNILNDNNDYILSKTQVLSQPKKLVLEEAKK